MAATNLNSFFTMESLIALQGAAAASLLVPNAFGYLCGSQIDKYRKWIAFAIAMGLAYITAYRASDASWEKWFLAFFNGLLIFSSAAGINLMGEQQKVRRGIFGERGRTFFVEWF